MEQVKKLREMTGAGIMDCKKALEANEGNVEKAIEYLRHKGIASASKREGREAKEGLLAIHAEGTKAAVIELNCETDFVARTDEFKKLADDFAKKVCAKGEGAVTEEESVNRVRELSGKVGEKMVLTRGKVLESPQGFVASYLHSNKKIGVLVAVEGNASDPAVQQCGKDVAMQIAAARPMFVSREEIPAEFLEREKELFRAELPNKPREMQEKIIQGKLEKWYEISCLLDQAFIKNDKQRVKEYIAETGRNAGQPIAIRRFARFELGG
ncbi:MAG: elongation factor Ts [Candidatus Omnitrophica bacterium]|nr:elongation factor Ts [Candidatus Omnitrophota bacterium]